jgi:hypothetical protein
MTRELHPDDLRLLADVCAEALTSVAGRDWSVGVPGLEWSALETATHLARVPLNYACHLATRATSPIPFRVGSLIERSDGSPASPATIIAAVRTLAWVLADVVSAAPAGTRAFHVAGMADRSGYVAMACDELLIHTDDILSAFGLHVEPPQDLVPLILARLFPWAPGGVDPWSALRWANGREDLPPPYGRLGPDWIWHCAPVQTWDGTIPRLGGA